MSDRGRDCLDALRRPGASPSIGRVESAADHGERVLDQ